MITINAIRIGTLLFLLLLLMGCGERVIAPPASKSSETQVLRNAFFELLTPEEPDPAVLYLGASDDSAGINRGDEEDIAVRLAHELRQQAESGSFATSKVSYAEFHENNSIISDLIDTNVGAPESQTGNQAYASQGNDRDASAQREDGSDGILPYMYSVKDRSTPVYMKAGKVDVERDNTYKSNTITSQTTAREKAGVSGSSAILPSNTSWEDKEDHFLWPQGSPQFIRERYPEAIYASPDPGLVIVLLPPRGIDIQLGKSLLKDMADLMYGPVVSDSVVDQSVVYILDGYFSVAAGTIYTSVIIDWRVYNITGDEVSAFFVQKILGGKTSDIDEDINNIEQDIPLQEIAQYSVQELMASIQIDAGQEDNIRSINMKYTNGIGTMQDTIRSDAQTIFVRYVRGAPGDGDDSIRKAIETQLSVNGLKVVKSPVHNAYVLEVDVEVRPVLLQHYVKILWKIYDMDEKIGEIVQEHAVERESLDVRWGENAIKAAEHASHGLMSVIKQHIEEKRRHKSITLVE